MSLISSLTSALKEINAQAKNQNNPLQTKLSQAADKYQVQPEHLEGILNYFSKGGKNQDNLMLLSGAVAKEMGVHNLKDPKENIEGAAKYLSQLQNRFGGDAEKALAAYFSGPNKIAKEGLPQTGSARHFLDSLGFDKNNGNIQDNPKLAQSQKALAGVEQKQSLPDISYETLLDEFLKKQENIPEMLRRPLAFVAEKLSPKANYPKGLGKVSEKYESGGRGVATVSTGKNDPGGVSYGKHQFSSKTGTMAKFLKSAEGKAFAPFLIGQPGEKSFNESYKKLATGPQAKDFEKAQFDYLARTHYEPALKAAKDLGFKVENPGVQEAIFSGSIQHGGIKKILKQSVESQKDFADLSATKQLETFYKKRASYAVKYAPQLKQALINRYTSELKDTINLTK
ncbi:MAG: transglycosylase SLT domain-containing protein [Deltaproteobacteria bacterium]|nr:transglycosylase SLT domain-containing protein [Deltaproteobacteria bacterium]